MVEPLQGHTVAHVFNSFPDIKKNTRFPQLLWGCTAFERGLLLSISKRFHLSHFFKSIFCHKVGTQHKLIQRDKAARVNFQPNKVQRWLIKGLLENHHYAHFGLKTLTEKHHYVLNFSLMWLQAEVMLRLSLYCLRVSWADLSMVISRQQEQCKLRDKSQQ